VYGTNLMLRALAPQDMTAAERREASEQLGKVAASLARGRRRLRRPALGWPALSRPALGWPALGRRAPGAAARRTEAGRRPAPLAGMNADVGERQFERECARAGDYALHHQGR
jgi:hypothetical protein